MASSANLIILLGFVAFFGLRGYFKGLFDTLFWLLGLVSAYIASFLVGPIAVEIIGHSGVDTIVAYVAGYGLVFILSMVIMSSVPKWLMSSVWDLKGYRFEGAILGGLVGAAIGLVGVWLFSTVNELIPGSEAKVVQVQEPQGDSVERSLTHNEAIQQIANKMVGKAVKVGVSAMSKGDSDVSSSIVATMVENPRVFVDGVQAVTDSDYLSEMWDDEDFQYMLATDDIDGILNHEGFMALMEDPAFNDMVTAISDQQGEVATDEFVASQMSTAWKRVQDVQDSPEFEALMQDEALMEAAQSGNVMDLLTNSKVKALTSTLFSQSEGSEDRDYTQFVGQSQNDDDSFMADDYSPQPVERSVEVYRWEDDQGQTQYTEYNDIPEMHRRFAEKIDY